jgi:hypothetical protein
MIIASYTTIIIDIVMTVVTIPTLMMIVMIMPVITNPVVHIMVIAFVSTVTSVTIIISMGTTITTCIGHIALASFISTACIGRLLLRRLTQVLKLLDLHLRLHRCLLAHKSLVYLLQIRRWHASQSQSQSLIEKGISRCDSGCSCYTLGIIEKLL